MISKKAVFEYSYALLTMIGVLGSGYLYTKVQERDITIQQWSNSYANMLQKKDDEIQLLKSMYRLTPIEKNEKPRPKGRG